MVALPPQLPRIDATEDRDLLHDFLALNQDLFALAEHSGRDLIELIAWTASPAIAPYIAQFRSLTADRLRWRALATLENILANPKNQTEERRAASTILRALTTPARAPSNSPPPFGAPPMAPSDQTPIEPTIAKPRPAPVQHPARETPPINFQSNGHHAAPSKITALPPSPNQPLPNTT